MKASNAPPKPPESLVECFRTIVTDFKAYEVVDEDYQWQFMRMNTPQIEKAVLLSMIDQEAEVTRLADGKTDEEAVNRVAKFIRGMISLIGHGFIRFNHFGCSVTVAPVGPTTTDTMSALLGMCDDAWEPTIMEIIRINLPWVISRKRAQWVPLET